MMYHAKPKSYRGYGGVEAVAKAMPDYIGGSPKAPNPRNAQIADALMAQGMNTAPVGHWTEGLARVGQALIGRRMANRAEREQEEYQKKSADRFNQAYRMASQGDLSGMGGVSREDRAAIQGAYDNWQTNQRLDQQQANWEAQFNRAGDWRGEDIQRGSTERKQDLERQEARWGVEDGFAQQRIAQADRGLDLQETSLNAQIEATKRENEAIDVDGEGSLRTEFNKLTDGFRDTYAAYGRLMESDGTTAPGQMSLVFQYMKMMDPGSTVREGEFANAENTRGVPGHVRAAYNKARSGLILEDNQVEEFKDQAAALYASEEQIYANQMRHYQGLATDYDLDVDRTIIDVRVPQFDDFGTGAPIEAVRDLLADPTPMAREEFDQIFGPGAAGKIIVGYGG